MRVRCIHPVGSYFLKLLLYPASRAALMVCRAAFSTLPFLSGDWHFAILRVLPPPSPRKRPAPTRECVVFAYLP